MEYASDQEEPAWRDLLLPDSVFRVGVGDARPANDPIEEMPKLADLASALPAAPARQYYLAKVSVTGQLPIRRAWEAIGCPRRVVVLSSLDDPGVALTSADSRADWSSTPYEVRYVSASDKAARVFLGASAMSRLALSRGDQVLLTVVGHFIVLANPGWNPIWGYWEAVTAREIGGEEIARPVQGAPF